MNDMDAVCQVESVHPRQIQQVENGMMAEDSLFQLAELFKAIGDSTRIRILHALSISELCVCDLADLLHMSSSAISHQLRVLRSQRIVTYRKVGKNAIYSLADGHVATLMEQGLQHIHA